MIVPLCCIYVWVVLPSTLVLTQFKEWYSMKGGILRILFSMEKWGWWAFILVWTSLNQKYDDYIFNCLLISRCPHHPLLSSQVPKVVVTSRKSSCSDLTVCFSFIRGVWFGISWFHLWLTEILCLMQSKKSKRRLRQPSTVPAAYAKVMKKLNFCG